MSGSLLFAASLGLLAWARTYQLALVAVVLLSGAWSLLIIVGNVLTPVAFDGSKAYATNLANVFFGIGAFLTPLAVVFLVRRSSLPRALQLLAGLALIPGALVVCVDSSSLVPPTSAEVTADTATLLADPILWLCGLALFCYGPLEASMGAWATTYLRDRGIREDKAASLLSGFWLSYMLTRLVTAFSLREGRETVLVLVLALVCVAVMAAIVLSRHRALAVATVLGAGLVFGPIFPTIMAILLGHFPEAVHGRAVGMFFAIGGIGWTMIPILIGAYARRTSIQRGFSIAVAAAVGLSLVALALVMR